MTIGDNLRQILNEKGITAYKLAKDGQVSNSYLSEILNNEKTNPSIDIVKKLASTLKVSVDDLIKS